VSHDITSNTVIVANQQQVTGDLPDGDIVILSLNGGVYYGLNSVGGHIWKFIQTPVIVKDIYNLLLNEYDVDAQECYTELIMLLEELAKNGLIQVKEAERLVS